MKNISAIAILALAAILSACSSTKAIPESASHAPQIGALKKIEIFYNHQDYAVIVQQAGGLLALASIGEADRTVQRSKAFTAAMEKSFPAQDLNLQFAQALADKIRARGVEVKLTSIQRPVGNADISKTRQYLDAPKTAGYAPMILRATTRYVAPSFSQGFQSSVDVSFLLADANSEGLLISTSTATAGAGETYMTFDALLAAHPAAHAQLSTDLMSLVPQVYSGIFQ